MSEIFVPIYFNLFKRPFIYLPLKCQAFWFSHSTSILYVGDTNPSDKNSKYFCQGQDVVSNLLCEVGWPWTDGSSVSHAEITGVAHARLCSPFLLSFLKCSQTVSLLTLVVSGT